MSRASSARNCLKKKPKMQTSLYGNYCSFLSAHRKSNKRINSSAHYEPCWEDEDFTKSGFSVHKINYVKEEKSTRPIRVSKAWLETWEVKLHKKDDAQVKYKLIHKYGGLFWKDPDNNDLLNEADKDDMIFNKVRGLNRGWHVKGLHQDDKGVECYDIWAFNYQLIGLIYSGVFVEIKPESFKEDGKWNFDDCGVALAAQPEAEKEEGSDDDGNSRSDREQEEESATAESTSKSKPKSKRAAPAKRRSPRTKKRSKSSK